MSVYVFDNLTAALFVCNVTLEVAASNTSDQQNTLLSHCVSIAMTIMMRMITVTRSDKMVRDSHC